jgi:hypothetical protein
MGSHEYFRTGGLSLEPLEETPRPQQPAGKGPAAFHAETRSKAERRNTGERREMLRFEDDRRKKDRRPKHDWAPGKNL